MPISEPMTVATDALLGVTSLYWGLALVTQAGCVRAKRRWGAGLALSGAGALTGGAWHALSPLLSPLGSALLWKPTLALSGAAGTLLVLGAALATRSPRRVRTVNGCVLVQLVLFAVAVTLTDHFAAVIAQAGLSLATVALLFLTARAARGRNRILAGVAVSIAGAAVQALRLAPHASFNHNDLFHVIQIVAAWLFYRGGRAFEDAQEADHFAL